jgi:ParB family chromosome partitioning protein
MATKATKKKVSKKKTTKKRRGVKLEPTELTAVELATPPDDAALDALAAGVAADGGAVLARYREPLGGKPLLLVSLPIERVQPTPFQRDVSDAHVRKLTRAMDKTRRFLDPIIVVRNDDHYMTPNGNHRLTVLRELGAKAVVALLVPERDVAYQILALNIEKAHNLRERAIEVMRMLRDLVTPENQTWTGNRSEQDFELEFEEPSLVTLGFAYDERGRLSGGAYHPVLKKVDGWIAGKLAGALAERERRARVLLALDDAVSEAVKRLKAKGFTSPYLKAFVVARINPLRFIKGDLPTFDDLMDRMTKKALGLDADKIRPEDVARSGGGAPE